MLALYPRSRGGLKAFSRFRLSRVNPGFNANYCKQLAKLEPGG